MTDASRLDEPYEFAGPSQGARRRTSTTPSLRCPGAAQRHLRHLCVHAAGRRLSDDESLTREERRRRLEAWLSDWRNICHGRRLVECRIYCDARRGRAVPYSAEPAGQLVAGVTMDLKQEASGAPDTYATFEELYRYCYLVASVVGLVCIRIFGYKDARAEKLAEETGIAFQLTNILRDVAEDAGRNRVYLPLEDLKAHGVALEGLLHRAVGAPPAAGERGAAQRDWQAGGGVLPLGRGAAAADRSREPAGAVGAGRRSITGC